MDRYQSVYDFLRSVQYGRQESDMSILFPSAKNPIPTLLNVISDRQLLQLVVSPFFLRNLTNPRVLENVTNPNFFLSLMVHNLFLSAEKRTNLMLSYLPHELFAKNVSDYNFDLLFQYLGAISPEHSHQVIQILGSPILYDISLNPKVRLILTDKPLLSFLCNPFVSEFLQTEEFWISLGEPTSLAPEYPAYAQSYAEQISTRQAMNIVAKTIHNVNETASFNGFRVNINMALLLRSIQIETDTSQPPNFANFFLQATATSEPTQDTPPPVLEKMVVQPAEQEKPTSTVLVKQELIIPGF